MPPTRPTTPTIRHQPVQSHHPYNSKGNYAISLTQKTTSGPRLRTPIRTRTPGSPYPTRVTQTMNSPQISSVHLQSNGHNVPLSPSTLTPASRAYVGARALPGDFITFLSSFPIERSRLGLLFPGDGDFAAAEAAEPRPTVP